MTNLPDMVAIERFHGMYSCTADGKIWSHKTNRYLSQVARRGYLGVSITANGKDKLYSVHRLVAEAYIPNPEGKATVNHIDGNKHNNSAANLEWATVSENHKHAFRTGLRDNRTEKQLECYRNNIHKAHLARRFFDNETIAKVKALVTAGQSQGKIAKMLGCCQSSISRLLSGENYKEVQ